MALRLSVKRLYKVDLPTFGRPTMATMLLMLIRFKNQEPRIKITHLKLIRIRYCFYYSFKSLFKNPGSWLLILGSLVLVPKLFQVIFFAAPVGDHFNKHLQEHLFLEKF